MWGAVPETFTITELTRAFGVSTRTLRFYEDEGLLNPIREGRTRRYRPSDRYILEQILRGKRLGFSIAEIREILSMYREPVGERGQLDLLAAKVESKRQDLLQKRRDIEETLAEFDRIDEAIEGRRRVIADRGGGDGPAGPRREGGTGAGANDAA